MADELKDQRVVTMMSPGELKTIDDWSFRNRIRSRGDAIRRLCQIAMIFDENAEDIAQQFISLRDDFSERSEKIAEMLETLPTGNPAVSEYAARTMDLLIDSLEKQQYLGNRLAITLAPADKYKTVSDFKDAQLDALAAKANHTAQFLETKVRMFEVRKKHEPKKD